jgi:hypothetical protein
VTPFCFLTCLACIYRFHILNVRTIPYPWVIFANVFLSLGFVTMPRHTF